MTRGNNNNWKKVIEKNKKKLKKYLTKLKTNGNKINTENSIHR